MKLAVNTTVAPTFDGLTLAAIKDQVRVDSGNTDDDTRLTLEGKKAVQWVEANSGYYFATRTVTVTMPCFPAVSRRYNYQDKIEIPLVPVTAVNSIKYYDTSNADTTWDSADYITVLNDIQPSEIFPGYEKTWPSAYEGRSDAVRIEMVVGYANESAVPTVLQAAALMKADQLYTQGGDDAGNPNLDASILAMMRSAGWGFYAGAY